MPCVVLCGHKPAEDFQQLRDSIEVLSFVNEPENADREIKQALQQEKIYIWIFNG